MWHLLCYKIIFLCCSHAFGLCTFQEHEMSGITWWKTHGNWKHTCFCTSEGLTIWLTPGCLSIYSYKVIMNQAHNIYSFIFVLFVVLDHHYNMVLKYFAYLTFSICTSDKQPFNAIQLSVNVFWVPHVKLRVMLTCQFPF